MLANIILEQLADPATLNHPFWEFDWSIVMQTHVLFCSVALFLSGVLCSAAGIGGGGVYVAVLMVLGGLSPHNAVPLSKAVVFFGAVITMVLNVQRTMSTQGATAKPSVINYPAVRITAPAALAGTFMGVALNWHAKSHTIVIILTLLLVAMTSMVSRTAWKQHSEEQTQQNAFTFDTGDDEVPHESAPLLPEAPKSKGMSKGKAQSEAFTLVEVVGSVALLLTVVSSGVLRFHMLACGEDLLAHTSTGACTHPLMTSFFGDRMALWMSDSATADNLKTMASAVPMWSCILVSMFTGRTTALNAGWSFSDILMYQVMGVTTGLLAGLVGVGGGLIFSPFFLLMGMDPSVAVGTSSTCVLFTSSSTTLQYILTDRVMMSLAVVYGLVTLAASYVGTSLVHALQDKFQGRKSYITLIVAAAVALSAVLSLVKLIGMATEPQTA